MGEGDSTMFELEIDKFRRVIRMKNYSLVHKLSEEFPNLVFESSLNLNGTSSKLIVYRKNPELRMYNTKVTLTSSFIDSCLTSVDGIYQAGSSLKKSVTENLDLLYSYIFKKNPNRACLTDVAIFDTCINAIYDKCTNFVEMWPFYTRSLLDKEESDTKDKLLDALIYYSLEVSGSTYLGIIKNFDRDDMLLNDYISKKIAEKNRWNYF